MRKKIDLDRIKDPQQRFIAELAQIKRQQTYVFPCEEWFLRVVHSISEKGEFVNNTFYEFSCVNAFWAAPKFSCTIQILECASPIHTDKHPEPCCGTLNLDYQSNPSDDDQDAKHGRFIGLLVMPADSFAKLHLWLPQRDLRPIIRIVVHDSLKEWDRTEQVYCEQYAIEFRPKALNPVTRESNGIITSSRTERESQRRDP